MNENGILIQPSSKLCFQPRPLTHPICGLCKSSLWPNDMGRINICRHPNKANAHLLKEAISLVLLSSNLDGQLSMFRNELDSLRMPARYAKRCKAVLVPGTIKMGSSILMQSQMSTTVPQSRAAQRLIEVDVLITACHELSLFEAQCWLLEIT